MGKNENQESCVPASLRQIRNRPYVGGKLDARQVLDVFVSLVDDLGELSLLFMVLVFVFYFYLYHFLKDPHVYPGFVKGKPFAISTHNGGYGRAPVSAANDADLVELIGGVLGVGGEGVGVVHGVCRLCHLGIISASTRIYCQRRSRCCQSVADLIENK